MGTPLSVGAALSQTTRGEHWSGAQLVETVHPGHLVVTGPDGSVVDALGDPDLSVFVRSAAKPLQTVACLELLGEKSAELSDAEVAVSWASHRGEARHLDAVAALLARSGTPPEALTCPAASAENSPGAPPTRIQHTCSGKHALFALAATVTGTPGDELLDPTGTLQAILLEELSQRVSIEGVGTDGCGAPAVVASLASLARSYAGLIGFPWGRRVLDAGLAHPGLVGGRGRLETALLEVGVIAKVGAEGLYAVGWTDRTGASWGLAARASAGSVPGAATAVIATLEGLGVVPEGLWTPPSPRGEPNLKLRPSAEVRDLVARVGATVAAR